MPVTLTSNFCNGEDSKISRARPFAVPAVLFQMTMFPNCFSARIRAAVEPTLPAPQIVIFAICLFSEILFLKVMFRVL